MLKNTITPEQIAEGMMNFEDLSAAKNVVAWTQVISSEGGRYALFIRSKEGVISKALEQQSLRSRLYEYGGGAITVDEDRIFAVCDTTKMLKEINIQDGSVTQLLDCHSTKIADMRLHPSKRWLFFIAEIEGQGSKMVSALCRLDMETKKVSIALQGASFYMSPALSSDGRQIAFVCWDDPYMSWHTSTIYLASITEHGTIEKNLVRISPERSSNLQPCFGDDGTLYFVSDISGFWSVMSYKEGIAKTLYSRQQECSFPHWKLGRASLVFFYYGSVPSLACIVTENAIDKLVIIDCATHRAFDYPLPFTTISHLTVYGEGLAFFASSAKEPRSLISIDPTHRTIEKLAVSCSDSTLEELASEPIPLFFPAAIKGMMAQAFYYPPTSIEKASLPCGVILRAHGGPTGMASPQLLPEVLFWTSRGFAFCDVNYTGSAGFGREFRLGLDGYWGERDAADCITCAKELIARGLAKEGTIFIRGSSSGGYTALMAASYSDVFAGVISYYGIADLSSLVDATHRFEKYYLTTLAGTENKDALASKSPLSHLDTIHASVLLLQGKEDPVVPAVQAEDLYLKLKERGKDVRLLLFDYEGHGFRRKESIARAFTAELAFVRGVLGL